ncbi:MAG: tRNA pseudouridine(55) synthase TruB [Clostridia bacterium]|nr:tRNA pseudouridine(55) synthase TruB [Clostridia bacterium]
MSTEVSGVLLIHKPEGKTSHDVVGAVRRLFHTRRVGHTGTLDPMATGVLVVLVGRAAKAAEYLSVKSKSYRAVMRLGLTTDTEDITGKTLTVSGDLPSPERVIEVAGGFVGEILQTPPMYSALKVNGQKLCDLARKGIEIEREARPVTIHAITCRHLAQNDYELSVSCSSGTYIRTLCADIGKALGCGGAMAALCRTETGGFPLSDCHTIEALDALCDEERVALLLPTERLFEELQRVCLPAFYEKLCRSGCEIYQKKIATDYAVSTRVRLCNEQGDFFALGEVREYENGSAIKSIKLFDI